MLNIDDRLIREVSPKIGPNALSVLLAISIHLNQKTNRCFPSHHTLMQLSGLGKNTVYDALNVLKECGLLVVEQSVNSKKKQFGRRTFLVNTPYIGVFVSAQDMEPLPNSREPESREPESREPESREPESRETYQINESEQINNEEQINKVEQVTPQAAAPTPPQPENQNHTTGAGEIGTVEADFSKNPARPLSPFAAIQGPHIRDFVKADTPGEMLERIAAFYATPQGQNERERIYSDTIAGKMSAPERTEVTKAFAAWAVEQNYGQKTFRELNARFTRWWKDQARYNAEKQPATHTQHHSPLNNRPDGPVMRSAVQIQKLPCTTTLTASE